MKISETIKALFRRQSRSATGEVAAPTDEERRREHEAVLTAQIEAEKLRSVNQLPPLG